MIDGAERLSVLAIRMPVMAREDVLEVSAQTPASWSSGQTRR